MKRKLKVLFIISIVIAALAITSFICLIINLSILFFKTTQYYDDNIDNYLVYDGHLYYNGTPSIEGTFPDDLSIAEEIVDYYYRAELPENFSRTFWEIVLHIKLSDDNYEKEIKRLDDYVKSNYQFYLDSGLANNISDEVKNSILFNYECYVMCYSVKHGFLQMDCHYEYVLVDNLNNEIIYIYIDNPIYNKHEINLNKIYLPINYDMNENSKTADNYVFKFYHYILN